MDSIAVQLYKLEHLNRYVPLLEMNVKDLKLAAERSKLIINDQAQTIANYHIIISAYEEKEAEYDMILESEKVICGIEKKRIRKRLLILGGSGTAGGLILGLIFGLIAN